MTRVKYIGQILVMTDIEGEPEKVKEWSEDLGKQIEKAVKDITCGTVEVNDTYIEAYEVKEEV